MFSLVKFLSLSLFFSLTFVAPSFGSPRTIQIRGTFNPTGTSKLITNIPGVGRVNLVLKQTANTGATPTLTGIDGTVSDQHNIILYRGTAYTRDGERAVAATNVHYHGKDYATLLFQAGSLNSAKRDSYRLLISDLAQSRYRRVSHRTPITEGCGLDHLHDHPVDEHQHDTTNSTAPAKVEAASSHVFELSIDADYRWYQLFGDKSNAMITAIVHETNVVYEDDIGMSIRVVRQNVYTDSSGEFGSPGAVSKLTAFREDTVEANHFGDADGYHLFTGHPPTDNILGVAWLGTICTQPTYAIALTRNYSFGVPTIFAHELGHNLGSGHVSVSPPSIMNPYLDFSAPMFFSDQAISTIQHRNSISGKCMLVDGGDGSGDGGGGGGGSGDGGGGSGDSGWIPTTLNVSLDRKGEFTAETIIEGGDPDCTFTLMAGHNKKKLTHTRTVLAQVPAVSQTMTFSGDVLYMLNKKAKKLKRKKKIFIGGEIHCNHGQAYGFAHPKRIFPERIKKRKGVKRTNHKRWMKELAKAIELEIAD